MKKELFAIMLDKEKLVQVQNELTVDSKRLAAFSRSFRDAIYCAVEHSQQSPFLMLPAYLDLPTGLEQGEFLTLDFGGTNVRASYIELFGDCTCRIKKMASRRLQEVGKYDYAGKDTTANELFEFLVDVIKEVVDEHSGHAQYLGHTFSFASEQMSLADARLHTWSKEFAVSGVEGELVNEMLNKALVRKGLSTIIPNALINDTVAVLLTAAYKRPTTYIGVIYATGFNICYQQEQPDHSGMILNMEAGNFNQVPDCCYDRKLDEASEKPGEQRLEKMISGRYLGELFQQIVHNFDMETVNVVTSTDLAGILPGVDGSIVQERLKKMIVLPLGQSWTNEQIYALQQIAKSLFVRSGRLAAGAIAGTISHRAASGAVVRQSVAIDGSIYEKVPLVRQAVRLALNELLGVEADNISLDMEKDGSGIGAAIASAIAAKKIG